MALAAVAVLGLVGVVVAAVPEARSQVPAPGPGEAVIVVSVAAERDLATGATKPLAGLTLQLFDGAGSAPGAAVTQTWGKCVSDADGDCAFTVPDTGVGGANRDRRFWIQQVDASPAGYFAVEKLVTSADGNTFQETAYASRTGTQLRAGETYLSVTGFMSEATGVHRSSGVWPAALDNPAFPTKCGLNAALVLDLSWSVQESGSQDTLKSAAKALVDALAGTPSQVALFTFGSRAPAPDDPTGSENNINRPLTPVSTDLGATTVKNWIDGIKVPDPPHQATNWDRGLLQVAQAEGAFDVVIVVTDGNPTRYGAAALGTGITTRFIEMENSIFSANTIKAAKGARVIAVGVGDGVSGQGDNLAAISGPVTGNSDARLNDYYQAHWDEASEVLKGVAIAGCSGSVTVVKEIVPTSNTAGDVTGSQPAGGWTFGISSDEANIDPGQFVTAPGTGAGAASFTLNPGVFTAPIEVHELAQTDYKHYPVAVNGTPQNAVCVNLATDPPTAVTVTDQTIDGAFYVTAGPTDAISCRVYNQPITKQPASIQVAKQWLVRGVDSQGVVIQGSDQVFTAPNQPSGFAAGLTAQLTPADAGPVYEMSPMTWGTVYSGALAGYTARFVENDPIWPSGCALVAAEVTGQPDGAGGMEILDPPLSLVGGAPYSFALVEGLNQFEIRNTVQCRSQLLLYKVLDAVGTAPPSTDWLLTATPVTPDDSGVTPLPAFSGRYDDSDAASAVTGDVTPGVEYVMAESEGHPEYLQYVIAPQQGESMAVGSSGSWLCELDDGTGSIFTDPSKFMPEGMFGSVAVPFGSRVHCFAVNGTAALNVTKVVDGGEAVPADWTFSAVPQGAVPEGLDAITNLAQATATAIRPGQTYRISENSGGPADYSVSAVSCAWDDPDGTRHEEAFTSAVAEIAVAIGGAADCAFTNSYEAPTDPPTVPAPTDPPTSVSPSGPATDPSASHGPPSATAPSDSQPGGTSTGGGGGAMPVTGAGSLGLVTLAALLALAAGAALVGARRLGRR
ncbi:MAG: VWA domain-containing protein [Bifidobacteriaceae bacterium]|jgi:hypothetical protein|nr:VWA domain-containing protein [Bifidobacteriaceae bacterium]